MALGRDDGLARNGVVNLDVIATVPRTTLERRITELSVENSLKSTGHCTFRSV